MEIFSEFSKISSDEAEFFHFPNRDVIVHLQNIINTNRYWTYALWLALFTIFYNLAEGPVSVFFGFSDEALTLFGSRGKRIETDAASCGRDRSRKDIY